MKIDEELRLKIAYDLGATFDYQQAWIKDQSKYKICRKARQVGMTTCLGIESLLDAIIRDNFVVCFVSPTQRQSSRLMRYVHKAFRKFERINKTKIPTEKFREEYIFFHHGSEIWSLPNNPNGIQGIDANRAVIDESGLFGANEGKEIIDAILGSLAAKKGQLYLSGKPKGKRGILWDYWGTDKGKLFKQYNVDWEQRAKQDPDYKKEVEIQRGMMAKSHFDETYGAQFLDEGVLVYTHELLETAVKIFEDRHFIVIPRGGTYRGENPISIGIDFAKKRNMTSIIALEKVDDKLYKLIYNQDLKKMAYNDQIDFICNLDKELRGTRITVDETGLGLPMLDVLVQRLGSKVEGVVFSRQSKEKLVMDLQACFKDARLAIPNDEVLYDQLHSFQKDYTDQGNVVFSGKVDETDFQDDKVIALSLAVCGLNKSPFQFAIL